MRMVRDGLSWSGHERNCAFLNHGGTFTAISGVSGLDFDDDGRSQVFVDWDGDGDLDCWNANRTGPRLRFLRNDLPAGGARGFCSLELRGTRSNRDAIGARVELELEDGSRSVQSVQAGSGFLSQSSRILHFGLGAEGIRAVRVRWPGGEREAFSGVSPGGRYLLVEGTGRAQVRAARPRALALAPSPPEPPRASDAARIVLPLPVELPRLEARTFDGDPLEIPQGKRPLLINFWASWCAPCVAELGSFTRAQDQLQGRLDILALSVDGLGADAGEPADAQRILEGLDFPFATGVATVDLLERLEVLQETLFDRRVPFVVPFSLLIDPDSRLAVIVRGPLAVEALLESASLCAEPDGERLARSLPFPGSWALEPLQNGGLSQALSEGFRERFPDEAARYLLAALEEMESEKARRTSEGESLRGLSARELSLRSDLAGLYSGMGELARSVEQYERVIDLQPLNPKALKNQGLVLASLGDFERAALNFERVLRIDERDPSAHSAYGNLLLLMRKPERARQRFARALELDPDTADAHAGMGRALGALGRYAPARAAFLRALELDPGDEATRASLATLERLQQRAKERR